MAQPSSVLSQTMRSISLAKIHEIEKQRDRYESRKDEVLSAAALHPDNIHERIAQLLSGVKKLCDRQLANDPRVLNIDLWLQQSSYDASLPPHMLQLYEALLRSKLEVQSRKLGIAHLWSRLVTEWMDSSTPIGEVPDSSSEIDEEGRQVKRLKELCDKFEEVVFTPLETDESKIEEYMQVLFSGDDASKALESMRHYIQGTESELLRNPEPFNRHTLRWCVDGLLIEDLLSEEKQAVLREIPKNDVILDEIADILNMRFADFDNWSWEAGEQGIPTLPRPQLNGKYRIWMDEDVLQAIFIHYIGMKNCVHLKAALTNLLTDEPGLWNWRTEEMTNVDRLRFEYFNGTRLKSVRQLSDVRSSLFREFFFLSQLPTSVTEFNRNRAYANDGEVQEDEEEEEKKNEKNRGSFNVKQKILRTLATEAIVYRTLHGEAAVVQSDLEWYATGLSHTTIFAIMRFLGFSERIVSFYQKVLQAPLNVVSTPGASPTGEPRIRRRGVPMAHAPEKFIGEMILFVMDLAVNKATGMLIYRLHDDLFLCGEPSRCARAWEAMGEFAAIMGVSFNKSKTGSVYLTDPGKSRDTETEAILPEGVVRIGHLLLDQDSREWVMDQDQIGEHVTQLGKQLAACTNILDWVNTWNNCISRFFSHTLGEPAYCFGLKHVDSVLDIYQRINNVLFRHSQAAENDENSFLPKGNVASYLKSKIEERFGVSNIPDTFIFLPERMGGLGVKNPFIPYLAYRNYFIVSNSELSPDGIMQEYPRKDYAKLNIGERILRFQKLYPDVSEAQSLTAILSGTVALSQDVDFLSFEEYTRYRELTSNLLSRTYHQLLKVPGQKGATVEPFVTEALASVKIKDEAKLRQIEWVLQLYQDELEESWGGSRLIDQKYLPSGLLTMMRRKAVQWTMVLLIPPACRPIFTTLHVLYPSTLLPALDLLDRRLVTRVILKQDGDAQHTAQVHIDHDVPDQEPQTRDEDSNMPEKQEDSRAAPLYHLVRSAQPHSHRRHQSTAAGGQVYIVRLVSWNCTCAAFAFSAFPPLTSSIFSPSGTAAGGYQILPASTRREEEESEPRDAEAAEQTWEFGGLSADGKDGAGSVPCCKHLLACLLAEKWHGVLGGYVEERLVGREEGAGLVGDL
ncbi:hypothetical protein GQX73_g1341 [Xylaria multiplex]|uniref:Reverse transcriptase domain-containing protein n=1 Tax=Xylaria multiplex TaxID=323545 RepID=A0A7C8IU08_9PEZI|nr:hypothetical protein GQX73_g1341 [Xylaria multiplex]